LLVSTAEEIFNYWDKDSIVFVFTELKMKVYENDIIRINLSNFQYSLTRTKSDNTNYGVLKVVFLEIQDFCDVMPYRLVKRISVPLFVLPRNLRPLFKNLLGQLYAEDEDATVSRNFCYVKFHICWPGILLWFLVNDQLSDLHMKRSPTQGDMYQMLYWYSWFSWWWARSCSKHVENLNKHIEKNCASIWSFAKNPVM
jgi:hypothetical protein